MALRLRPLTAKEAQTIKKWSQSRAEAARLVERARIIQLASQGHKVPQIAAALGIDEKNGTQVAQTVSRGRIGGAG